jgi:hypothetical protein
MIVVRLTLSPLQAVLFERVLEEASERNLARGLMGSVSPRYDTENGVTVLELQLGAVSRRRAAKIQQLINEDRGNPPPGNTAPRKEEVPT